MLGKNPRRRKEVDGNVWGIACMKSVHSGWPEADPDALTHHPDHSGRYAMCHKGLHKASGKEVAIKVLYK
jgi:hypothetical protein